MNVVRLALLSLVCLAPLAAGAQWMWVDKDGHKVFSDQAPPSDVPTHRILRQPGTVRGKSVPTAAATAAAQPAAAASVPAGVDPGLKPSGKDRALEERRKEAVAAEARKKKEIEEKNAAIRADNCARARDSKTSFDTGQRIAFTNAQGEREFMSDEKRAAEVKRLEDIIARNCPNDRQ